MINSKYYFQINGILDTRLFKLCKLRLVKKKEKRKKGKWNEMIKERKEEELEERNLE